MLERKASPRPMVGSFCFQMTLRCVLLLFWRFLSGGGRNILFLSIAESTIFPQLAHFKTGSQTAMPSWSQRWSTTSNPSQRSQIPFCMVVPPLVGLQGPSVSPVRPSRCEPQKPSCFQLPPHGVPFPEHGCMWKHAIHIHCFLSRSYSQSPIALQLWQIP